MRTRTIRRLAFALALVVLATSGAYLLVYLRRWEWSRATISGIVFLATLLIMSMAIVAQRLGELADRVDSRSADPAVADAIRVANGARATRHFQWLRPETDRLSVFVPILLGTGMILSAVAYLVERVAGLLAGATVDRRTAATLPIHLPLGGHALPVQRSSAPRAARRGRSVAAVVALVVVAAAGVEVLRRLTQSPEGSSTATGSTSLTIDVDTKRGLSPEVAVQRLWAVCAGRLDGSAVSAAVSATGDRFVLQLDRALGDTARRRIVGCLEDYTIDFALAEVETIDIRPTD